MIDKIADVFLGDNGLPFAEILTAERIERVVCELDKQPRQFSFTGACQYVLASWRQLSSGLIDTTGIVS